MSERALIVGCGRIAGGYNAQDERRVLTHVVAYHRLGVEVAGCVDADAGIARSFAQRWRIARHGTALADLLTQTQPTVVSVCTPPDARLPLLDAILACGSVRSLLLEKPLARAPADARAIVERLARSGVAATVNYFRAFDPAYREIERAVRAGAWGPFRTGAMLYSGAAWSNPPHFLERLVAMLGEPRAARRIGGPGPSPAFVVEFESGPVHGVACGDLGYAPYELDLCFERGRLRIVDSEQRVELFEARRHPDFPGTQQLFPAPWNGPAPSHESLLHAVRAAVDAVAGSPADPQLLARAAGLVHLMHSVLDAGPH